MKKLLFNVILVLLLISFPCSYRFNEPQNIFAETRQDIEKNKLDKLKTTLNEQHEKIQKKQYRELRYLREFSEIEFAIALKRKNLLLAELMMGKLENDIHVTQAEIGKLNLNLNQKQQYIQKRLEDLFKVSRQPLIAVLLSKESMVDIYRQLEYLRVLVKKDEDYAREYGKIVRFWLERKKTLEQVKMDAVIHRQEIWPQKEGLKNDLARRENFLSGLKKSPSKYKGFLKEIQRCREMLHEQVARANCNAKGPGLESEKAKLELQFPVSESLLKNQKNKWVKDKFHPVGGGLEFFLPEGTEIQSIGPGVVCFADWFIGFGNVIIIDHGNRWVSLYAYCEYLQVEQGETVDSGQLIGYIGDSSSLRGFALYFELLLDNRLNPPLDVFGIKF